MKDGLMKESVPRQIAELQTMPYDELKERWRMLYGGTPPAYNKVFIIKRLTYRIQELAYGGLSISIRERMRQILVANGFDENGWKAARKSPISKSCAGLPVLGTKISREWNGRRYEVTVVHGGFEYDGNRYRSLTAVAKAITGTHWNGRVFFGIRMSSKGIK